MSYIYDLTDTWNAAGTVFTSIKMNVTNSASANGSKLIDLQIGGVSLFNVDKNGGVGIGTSSPVSNAGYGGLSLNGSSGSIISMMQGGAETFRVTNATGYSFVNTTGDTPLLLGTNATERMRIDGAGNVGIGGASSGARLQVNAASSNSMRLYNTSGNGTIIDFVDQGWQSQLVGSAGTLQFNTGGTTERMRIDSSGNVGIGTSSPNLPLTIGAVGTGFFGSSSLLNMYVNSGLKATLDSSGNLGLGVTPSAWSGVTALQMASSSAIAGNNQYLDFTTNAYYNTGYKYVGAGLAAKYAQQAGAHVWSTAPSGTAGNAISFTQAMTLDASGNLLVGTTTNSARLFTKVTDGSNSFGAAGTTKGVRITHDSTMSTIAGVDYTLAASYQPLGINGSDLRFLYSGTEAMRIDSSGNLLVGTTTTGSSTTTDGFVVHKNASGGGMVTYVTNGGTGIAMAVSTQADTQAIAFFRSGTQVGNIALTSTTTTYNTSSDYRLKDIDGPIQNSGAYIDALKPVQGSWKADGSRFIGLIAHEVQEVSETQIATGVKDGEEMQAMDYSAPEIIANLIAEIQSLRARVAQLEGN